MTRNQFFIQQNKAQDFIVLLLLQSTDATKQTISNKLVAIFFFACRCEFKFQ